MKTNQYKKLTNQSKFHEQLRDIFCTVAPFKQLTCLQEVNVKDLFPEYRYTNHHYDWYIKELMVIIELHGQQHYKPVNFGNMTPRETIINFNLTRYRDDSKRNIAIENGFTYIEIPYQLKKHMDGNLIMELINESN